MADVKLVIPSNLVKFGNSIARSIRTRLRWSKQLRKSVRVGRVMESSGEISITISVGEGKDKSGNPLVGMARAYEFGSGIHGRKKRKYKIVPKRAQFLMFSSTQGGLGLQGGVIKTKEVQHPGVDPRPYIRPALQAKSKEFQDLKLDVRKNLISHMQVTIKKNFGKQ